MWLPDTASSRLYVGCSAARKRGLQSRLQPGNGISRASVQSSDSCRTNTSAATILRTVVRPASKPARRHPPTVASEADQAPWHF